MKIKLTLGIIFSLLFFLCIESITAQIITNFAGGGTTLGDGGPATSALVFFPAGGVFDSAGNYYFEENDPRIRIIDRMGIIHTVAGTGIAGFSGDGGPATDANLNNSCTATVDASGNIYLADWLNYRIRKVDKATGIIHTIAGNGTATVTGNGGLAIDATVIPSGICVDKIGNIYEIDSQGAWVRKIDTFGIITAFAGNGIPGYSGDGGLAISAKILGTNTMCTDSMGNLFIGCDTTIRKVDISTGIISKVAGTGNGTYTGDEIHADSAGFVDLGMCFDAIGNLYIADYGNYRVRKIDTAGIIHTVAGTGVLGYSGDGGPATDATIHFPEGVATDACGNLYFADEANKRIRKVSIAEPFIAIPSISLSGIITASLGTTVTLTATVAGAGSSYMIEWFNHGIEFTTTTVPSVTYTKGAGIDTITAKVVSTSSGCYDSTTSAGHIVTPVSVTTGVTNTALGQEINIYPNPASNQLTITSPQKINTITISNILGQMVLYKESNNAQEEVDIGNLPQGMYLVKVTDDKGVQTVKRIIKE